MGTFTLEAKRKLLRAGGALGRFDPEPSNCVFFTGTLPGGTEDAFRTIAERSAQIVQRAKVWIYNRYKECSYSFYCWELQKRGALHLHYVAYCPCPVIRKK